MGDPSTAEWVVVVNTHPPAMKDVGILSLDWPESNVIKGKTMVPEATVHNYSNTPEDIDVRIQVKSQGIVQWSNQKTITALPGDSSRKVVFDGWQVSGTAGDSLNFEVSIVPAASDSFPSNDTLSRYVHVTNYPVFRLAGSGYYPLGAFPADIDGDGTFIDGTYLLGRQIPYSPGYCGPLCFLDLNGDGDVDIYSVGGVFRNMNVPDVNPDNQTALATKVRVHR